jgi:hypothetical protein
MADNWNLAVNHAQGEYICVLGNDDGILPYALRELSNLIDRFRPRAMTWPCGHYTWPDMTLPGQENHLAIPLNRYVREMHAREQMATVLTGREITTLPNVYHGLVHRSLFDALREKAGNVFATDYPDTYAAFSFAYLVGSYLQVCVPMTVSGMSGQSNNVAYLDSRKRLEERPKASLHPWVPDLPVISVVLATSFQTAKESVFPEDDSLCLNRKILAEQCLRELWTETDGERQEALRRIRDTFVDRRDLQVWFDHHVASQPTAAARFSFRPPHLGFDGDRLHLDSACFGVTDVAGAVDLCAKVLGYKAGQIQYDLQPLAEAQNANLQAQNANLQRTLDRSWSCLPHRIARKLRMLLAA